MNYTVNIQELEAAPMVAPQQHGEVREDYDARVKAAQNKLVMRVAALDDEASSDDKGCILTQFSPYYDDKSEQQRWNMVAKTMKKIGKDIIKRETEKARKPRLILPG